MVTGLYAPGGSIRVTEVDGTTLKGLYAPDGSWHVFEVAQPSVTWKGAYHACGALNVTDATDDTAIRSRIAPDGSTYTTTSGIPSAAMLITDVSGTIGAAIILWLWMHATF